MLVDRQEETACGHVIQIFTRLGREFGRTLVARNKFDNLPGIVGLLGAFVNRNGIACAINVFLGRNLNGRITSYNVCYTKLLRDANNKICSIKVNWHFEEGDEDSVETAEIYEESLLRVAFRYLEYAEAA